MNKEYKLAIGGFGVAAPFAVLMLTWSPGQTFNLPMVSLGAICVVLSSALLIVESMKEKGDF